MLLSTGTGRLPCALHKMEKNDENEKRVMEQEASKRFYAD
jgi:hypothetical protein